MATVPSPPLKPIAGTSWTSTFHRIWARKTPAHEPAPLAVLEHPEGVSSSDEDDLKDGFTPYEQATELLYQAQDDIISHAYPSALAKLQKAARLGSSAACAYLSSVYTHGLDCTDHDHDEDDVVAVDPVAAARWANRGLQLELAKSVEPLSSPDIFATDLNASSGSQGSSIDSEFGGFDLQAAADLASSLNALFRNRRIRPDTADALDAKGKVVNMYDTSVRTAERMLGHVMIRDDGSASSPTSPTTRSHYKLRKAIRVNMLYLVATTLADGEGLEAEQAWQRVIAVGGTGDRETDDLMAKAQRRLNVLQTTRRESESSLQSQQKPTLQVRSRSHRANRRSPPLRRGSTFEVGGGDSEPSTPDDEVAVDPMSSVSVPSPPTSPNLQSSLPSPARHVRQRSNTTKSSRLHRLSCLFLPADASRPSSAPATVAVERDAHALLAPSSLRTRAVSVVSLAHSPVRLPMLSAPHLTSLGRQKSSASLPDFNTVSVDVRAAGTGRRATRHRHREWVDRAAQPYVESPMDEAASLLRSALRRHHEAQNGGADLSDVAEDAASPSWQTGKPKAATMRIRGTDAGLRKIEDASRVNVVSTCAACEAKGVNFPTCPKCQRTYCSRACRIGPGGDGVKHVCVKV